MISNSYPPFFFQNLPAPKRLGLRQRRLLYPLVHYLFFTPIRTIRDYCPRRMRWSLLHACAHTYGTHVHLLCLTACFTFDIGAM